MKQNIQNQIIEIIGFIAKYQNNKQNRILQNMKQIEFNIRTLKNKQNGGGLFYTNHGLTANQFYKVIKGCQDMHDGPLQQTLTAKQIKARNLHQTIKLIYNHDTQRRDQNEGAFGGDDEQTACINSQYIDVQANFNIVEKDEQSSQQALSNAKNQLASESHHKMIHHDQSGIVDIICNTNASNHETLRTDQRSQAGNTSRYINSQANNASPLVKINKHNLNQASQDIVHVQSKDSKESIATHRSNVKISSQQQLQLMKGNTSPFHDGNNIICQPSQIVADASQSLKLLTIGVSETQKVSKDVSGKVQQINSRKSSKTEKAPKEEEPNPKYLSNKFSKNFDKIADLILQDDTADNEMMQHAGRDDKMDKTSDQRPRHEGITDGSYCDLEMNASQKEALKLELLNYQKLKERLGQHKYITPQELMQARAMETGPPGPQSRLKAKLNKFEQRIMAEANIEAMGFGSKKIDRIVITARSTPDKDKEVPRQRRDPVNLVLKPQEGSKVQFEKYMTNDGENKHIYDETYTIQQDNQKQLVSNHIQMFNNEKDSESRNQYQESNLPGKLEKTPGSSRQVINLKSDKHTIQVSNTQKKQRSPVSGAGAASRASDEPINNKNQKPLQIFNKKVFTKNAVSPAPGEARQQNESQVSRISMHQYNQQRLQSPRYNISTNIKVGHQNSSTNTINGLKKSNDSAGTRQGTLTMEDNTGNGPLDTQDSQSTKKEPKLENPTEEPQKSQQLPELNSKKLKGKPEYIGKHKNMAQIQDKLLASKQRQRDKRGQIMLSPQLIGNFQDQLMFQPNQTIKIKLDKLKSLKTVRFSQDRRCPPACGDKKIKNSKLPANAAGYQTQRLSENFKKRTILDSVEQNIGNQQNKRFHQIAQNQMSNLFNQTISPRFQQVFRNSLRNFNQNDPCARVATQVFGLQDQGTIRQRFLSLSIDSFDSSSRDQNSAQNTRRIFQNINKMKFNQAASKTQQSTFTASVNIANQSQSSSTESNWAKITAQGQNTTQNDSFYKNQEKSFHMQPNHMNNTELTNPDEAFQAAIPALPTCIQSVQPRLAGANATHSGPSSGTSSFRNVNTSDRRKQRYNRNARHRLDTLVKSRQISSQEHDLTLLDNIQTSILNNQVGSNIYYENSQSSVRTDGQREAEAAKLSHAKMQNYEEYKNFHEALSPNRQSLKGKASKLRSPEVISLQRRLEKKYEINLDKQSTGMDPSDHFNDQQIESKYLDEYHNLLPHQQNETSFIMQKLSSRESQKSKDSQKCRPKMQNKDLGSELAIKQHKGQTRTSAIQQTGPLALPQGQASDCQASSKQNEKADASRSKRVATNTTLFLEAGQDNKQHESYKILNSELTKKETKDIMVKQSNQNDDREEQQKSVVHAKAAHSQLIEIDEKSQVKEMTHSDLDNEEEQARASSEKSRDQSTTFKSFGNNFKRNSIDQTEINDNEEEQMNFEQVKMQTLTSKQLKQKQMLQAQHPFAEFAVIQNAAGQVDPAQITTDPPLPQGTSVNVNDSKGKWSNSFDLKESSMQTDGRAHSPVNSQALRNMNNDIQSIQSIQGIFNKSKDKFIKISTSPRSQPSQQSHARRKPKESGHLALSLSNTQCSVEGGPSKTSDKIKVSISKKMKLDNSTLKKMAMTTSNMNGDQTQRQQFITPRRNGMPIIPNVEIVPQHIIMSQTARFGRSPGIDPKVAQSTIQSLTANYFKKAQSKSPKPSNLPVACFGKTRLYDNTNVFFQQNPKQMHGRIQNVGANFAQRVALERSVQPIQQQSPRGRNSLPGDSIPSITAESFNTNEKGQKVRAQNIGFIDFNSLQVIGQGGNVAQQLHQKRWSNVDGRGQGKGTKKRRSSPGSSSQSERYRKSQVKKQIHLQHTPVDENTSAPNASSFEIQGAINPRYNGKVIISTPQRSMWEINCTDSAENTLPQLASK